MDNCNVIDEKIKNEKITQYSQSSSVEIIPLEDITYTVTDSGENSMLISILEITNAEVIENRNQLNKNVDFYSEDIEYIEEYIEENPEAGEIPTTSTQDEDEISRSSETPDLIFDENDETPTTFTQDEDEISRSSETPDLIFDENDETPTAFTQKDTEILKFSRSPDLFLGDNVEISTTADQNEDEISKLSKTPDLFFDENGIEEISTTAPINDNEISNVCKSPDLFSDDNEKNNNEALQDSDIENFLTKKGMVRKRKLYKKPLVVRQMNREMLKKERHAVKPPCSVTLKKQCITKITQNRRFEINLQYWRLSWSEQGVFLKTMCTKNNVKRKTVHNMKRNYSFTYYFKNSDEEFIPVCQTFFLTTIGYNKSNNGILRRLKNNLETVTIETRGKHFRDCTYKEIIKAHIESFQPTLSHYRREHAPNRRYLPSDITISIMHKLYCEENSKTPCSYDTYRNVLKTMNISFTVLGHEECEQCEIYNLHKLSHNHMQVSSEEQQSAANENIISDELELIRVSQSSCDICMKYLGHQNRVRDSREKYEEMKSLNFNEEQISFSVDLQKVIMLPRLEGFKQVLFSKRIIAFNESFVPIGTLNTTLKKPFAVLWHECISGRMKEDIVSAFYAFFLKYRDAKEINLWLDNCSAQNKNWALFCFLVQVVNSSEISTDTININYFEPGHTFMSADSFHHQVELGLKRQKRTYDFMDFVDAVKSANKGNVSVKEMEITDFKLWSDTGISQFKINRATPRAYLRNIMKIKFVRNSYLLHYANSHKDDFTSISFLKKDIERNGFPETKSKQMHAGLNKHQCEDIKKNILLLMPENRKKFWLNLCEHQTKQ